MSNNIKKYKLSTNEKILLWLNNYELGESIIDSIRFARYCAMDQFASRMVKSNNKDFTEGQDFLFTLSLDQITEIQLKKYLLKQKKVILNHIIKRGYNLGSHLYQFYLQYMCDELDNVEKNIFLEKYVNMVKDIKGEEIADQKRKTLEKTILI